MTSHMFSGFLTVFCLASRYSIVGRKGAEKVSPCISRSERPSISSTHTLPDRDSDAFFISCSGCEPDSANNPLSSEASQTILICRNSSGTVQHQPVAPGAAATDPSTLRPMSDYLTLDPTFSEAEMQEKLRNLYVQFQEAWHNKDLTPLRPYLSDAYYAQSDRQLDSYRRNNQTSYIERISVLGTELKGFKQESGNDVIIARLQTRITNYVLDDRTGELVRGSKTAEKFMDYEWELIRTSGRTTAGSTGTVVQNCPNCGAVININRTAQCEFCGSIVTVDSFDWVVNGIKGISQRTAG